jgi:uncharacterized protein (DUF488 family)
VAARVTLFTIGHGAVDFKTFSEYLAGAAIGAIVDVRRFPGSRRHPQFSRDELERHLHGAGVAYRHEPDLGGRRRPQADSPNAGLRNEGFRGYADWMTSEPFAVAFAGLLRDAAAANTAVMCAETPWWKCHRRLIADAAVLLAGAEVVHVMGERRTAHVPTEGVVAERGRLVYPATYR